MFRVKTVGLVLITVGLGAMLASGPDMTWVLVILVGAAMVGGRVLKNITVGKHITLTTTLAEPEVTKEIPPEERRQREQFAESLNIPGEKAPPFSLVNYRTDLDTFPGANPLVPMYVLDDAYRILDWNQAFGVAFDHTMEGRRGMSVLEWVYFLDNFQDVVTRAQEAFAEGKPPPPVDVEPIRYTSPRFGQIDATKRAYQIPSETGACVGWLVLLDLSFSDASQETDYQTQLIRSLQDDLLWSEYAICYDRVLSKTKVYPQLLDDITGRSGRFGITPIQPNQKVLDLGAGTGNLSESLLSENQGRLVVAVENNRFMFAALRAKCRQYLRDDDEGPGMIAAKQDATSLYGLGDKYFDYVLLNNVLYSLVAPESCLREAYRVLRPGGEIRISGPQKSTNLSKLFRRIRRDLKAQKQSESVKAEVDRVEEINRYKLGARLYQWDVAAVKKMLADAGFTDVVAETDRAYAGQAMIVCARK